MPSEKLLFAFLKTVAAAPDIAQIKTLDLSGLLQQYSVEELDAFLSYLSGLCPETIDLNLSDNHLTMLPSSISLFANLQSLNVDNNQLKVLPASLSKMAKLRTVRIQNNPILQKHSTSRSNKGLAIIDGKLDASGLKLTSVPPWLGHLPFIHSLDLSHNQLCGIPTTIAKLPYLSSLNLRENPLQHLSRSFCMTNGVLSLSRQKISVVPDSISYLHNLSSLVLNGNNLTELPDSLGTLLNLKHLEINRNKFATRPAILAQLNLDFLDISDNPFWLGQRTLSSSDIRKLKKLLQSDDFDRVNAGTELWESSFDSFEEFNEQLLVITAKKNKDLYHSSSLMDVYRFSLFDLFERFPFGHYLVYWSMGTLAQFPEMNREMNKITQLNINTRRYFGARKLARSPLTSIPSSLKHLKRLTTLSLIDQKFSELPEEMGEIKSLTDLSICRVPTFELSDSIGCFTQLKKLSIISCNLSQLPKDLGNLSNVTSLHLGSNHLQTLPEEFSLLSNLRSLNIEANPWNLQQVAPILSRLPLLKELRINFSRFPQQSNRFLQKALPNCKIS